MERQKKEPGVNMQRFKHVRVGLEPGELHVREEKTDLRSVSESGWAGHGGWWHRKVARGRVL